ncbi:hypothetical protein ASE08_08090 [Rhizobacter sp. Root16D2]|nr:hypothetical protein ASC88_06585 [Rhizobacter sp. Root29]KQW13103.1 hypothetical protein ASC98_18920 [Rhizobacter sp. Root1238]KRB14410.1 hypothetical protein ASE08_08090 [Rhizobacter sp. Root16D2]
MLICAYRPRYLDAVLKWLRSIGAESDYKIFAWDNGGAATILRQAGLEWQCVRDEATQEPVNVGKALAMRYLFEVVNDTMPDADCYICMDDDIVADRAHLAALVAAARRPGMGMIAPRFHPFNSVAPEGGTVTHFDACPRCRKPGFPAFGQACEVCGGTGKDPTGLRLRTYPVEDRTVHKKGKVAGGLFAVSKAAIGKLPWAPHPYPILTGADQMPAVYWTEDATLDHGLTVAGLINGYLEGDEHIPAIHLPELDPAYMRWKLQARERPGSSSFVPSPTAP